jgi:hypothetical protein
MSDKPAELLWSQVVVDLPCVRCGYNLRTRRAEERCPECGESVAASFPYAKKPAGLENLAPPIRFAAGGLAVWLLSWLLLWFFGCTGLWMLGLLIATLIGHTIFAVGQVRLWNNLGRAEARGRPIRAGVLGLLATLSAMAAAVYGLCVISKLVGRRYVDDEELTMLRWAAEVLLAADIILYCLVCRTIATAIGDARLDRAFRTIFIILSATTLICTAVRWVNPFGVGSLVMVLLLGMVLISPGGLVWLAVASDQLAHALSTDRALLNLSRSRLLAFEPPRADSDSGAVAALASLKAAPAAEPNEPAPAEPAEAPAAAPAPEPPRS